MKTLQDFIIEKSQLNEGIESKTITFDFSGLDNAEDTLKSFEDREGCTTEDNKLTVNITKDNVDKLGKLVVNPGERNLALWNRIKNMDDF